MEVFPAKAVVVDIVLVARPPRQGIGGEQGDRRQQRPTDISAKRAAIGAGEIEPDIAIAAVAGIEAQRGHHQPRNGEKEEQGPDKSHGRHEMDGRAVSQKDAAGDQAAQKNAQRRAMIIEIMFADISVAVEIALVANLRPGAEDAQRDDGQRQVDDPDFEIFAARSFEPELMADHRRRWRRVCSDVHSNSPTRRQSLGGVCHQPRTASTDEPSVNEKARPDVHTSVTLPARQERVPTRILQGGMTRPGVPK